MTEQPGDAARAWARRSAAIEHNATRIGIRGPWVVAAAALAASALTLVVVGFVVSQALAVVVPFALALLLRVGVISPAVRQVRHLPRRLLLRWVPRLLWLASLPLWAWVVVPWLNVLLLPALWAAQTRLVALYVRWTVQREVDGLRPHPLEWALLGAAAVTVVGVALMLVALGLLGAWVASWWSAPA